jgi:hypothetical protein
VEGKWQEREAAHVESLAEVLKRSPRPVELIGEGIPYHRQYIPEADKEIVIAPQETWRARAAVLARIGGEMARDGKFVDPFLLEPIYIRVPEAQEKMEGKLGAS